MSRIERQSREQLSNGVRLAMPNSTPMPRLVVWGKILAPSALAFDTSSSQYSQAVGSDRFCTNPNDTGRPVRIDSSFIHATSRSITERSGVPTMPWTWRSLSTAHSKMPLPRRPITSPMAYSSSGRAQVPGTSRPSGTTWR